jgi:crossover junction endodeoxyribonuclease RuvC
MPSETLTILGVDPGSRITGFGVIKMDAGRSVHVDSGTIPLADLPMPERLGKIFRVLSSIILQHPPDEVAIERVFMHRNADSALKLGQARGAAIVACANVDLPVYEYSATQIKQAIVGRGHADKEQVKHMIKALLCLPKLPPADAADALATAICHGHTQLGLRGLSGATSARGGRSR